MYKCYQANSNFDRIGCFFSNCVIHIYGLIKISVVSNFSYIELLKIIYKIQNVSYKCLNFSINLKSIFFCVIC